MTNETSPNITAAALAKLASDLRIADTRVFNGASIWHVEPVVLAELHTGELAELAPADLPDVMVRIHDALPALGRSPGTWGALLVRVALELQRVAGVESDIGIVARESAEQDRVIVMIGFDDPCLAEDALHGAARVMRDCLRGDDPEVDELLAGLARRHQETRLDADATALIDAARRRGIPVRRDPDNGAVQLGLGANLRRLPERLTGSADDTLDALYPAGASSVIPVIAVTGTNGKTTTTRLIAHLFRQSGARVGYTTTDGVYFQEELLLAGDLTGPFAANMILSHAAVEVAVLETARGGILRAGLGFEQCDVAVVTNVTSDHLGLKGIETIQQLAEVKAVLPAVVKPSGYAILNADDPLVSAMRERTPGHVAFFSTRTPGESAMADEHVARGGIVARMEREGSEESFVIRAGDRREVLGTAKEVPLTFGGLARFQFGNVLAAAAAAYVQGLRAEQIRDGLLGFVPSARATPGRLNVMETTRGRVIIDYAHNAAAISGLVEFLVASPARRRVALLSAPGDRRDEDLRAIGRLATSLDLVVMKEHEAYRRGRQPGEINAVMTEGLIGAGFPAERARSFVEEHDAVDYVLGIMQPGDIVAIIADDEEAVANQLRPYLV